MAPPELVIAGSPYTLYPGGVIAVRCADFMGAARGTLTSEVNALAATGEVVRDSQQVTGETGSILNDVSYAAADDTLVIPAGSIPLAQDGDVAWWVHVNYRVEGEWDLTNGALLRRCSDVLFDHVALIGLSSSSDPDTAQDWVTRTLARREHFGITRIFLDPFDVFDLTTDDIIIRAFTQQGTTAEVLLDQLVFIPFPGGFVEWSGDDFKTIDSFLIGGTTATQDGDDGGDDNGKFTWHPGNAPDGQLANSGIAGSRDYQRKADGDDAEYATQVVVADGLLLENSLTGDESLAHAYSLHCARHRSLFIEDDYDDRTTSSTDRDFGLSEDGFGYDIGFSTSASSPTAWVDGVGHMRINQLLGVLSVLWGSNTQSSGGQDNQGARLQGYDQWSWAGSFEHGAVGNLGSGTIRILAFNVSGNPTWMIRIASGAWSFGRFNGTTFTTIDGPHVISGWGPGYLLGWRMEVKRYLIRVRIWDASGAEPSTWDYESFKPIVGPPASTVYSYPYGDSEAIARLAYGNYSGFGIQIDGGLTDTIPYELHLHHMEWEHDPYGDPADISVRMETPEGASLGDVVVPWGAPYFVYWGLEDFTDLSAGDYKLRFSSRAWNDPAAAEIQSAETMYYWFRSVHFNPTILSMNWRSSDRMGQSRRVLVGS